jgi:hypothetical protein
MNVPPKPLGLRITSFVMLVLILVWISFLPKHSAARERATTPAESAAAQVAQDYAATRFPEFDTVKNPPLVQDKGDSWEVEYELPKGTLGGTPVAIVDKNTLKVLRSFHTQ